MSESTVSTTVAFLFGGMIFLLTYTRLGGMATTLLAAAILVAYLAVEAWHAWHNGRRAKDDRHEAYRRWDLFKTYEAVHDPPTRTRSPRRTRARSTGPRRRA